MASYLFRQFLQLHKTYEYTTGTRNVQLWHYKGKKKKNWPAEFRKSTVLKLKRGEPRKMQHEDVTAVVWQDKRVVLLLSTNSNPQTDGSVTKKQEKAMKKLKLHVLKPS